MNTHTIWMEFNKDLKKYIQTRVNNKYDVEDILQDVFKKVHNSIHTLTDEGKIQSWVYQITRNTIIDYYRVSAKKKNIETHLDYKEEFSEEEVQENNLNKVVSGWLNCIVQELDEKYREAILLTELGNFTQKELAERLGISISGAKSRVQRGREKIKELLLACCHIERDRLGNVIDFESKSSNCNCSGCHS
ncbi:RNA polymerase sigma factor SigZ [Paenibacillus oryzisoli]|uniref:RNA polymerase sigma factor SigZ n=1 Tax=Paenibacillus oryzisoli TaxID=1850517 RepID=A0A198AIQ0_9BACL|nr:RNA polymerase sigma factor SigZ [Paenibacillus oryzisoli]OAS21379.1 RNA polymerase sigma factor SigZ [Paenibacillus oryzisoli]